MKNKKPVDYTRVCNRCGHERLLPREIAEIKAPKDRQVKAMDRQVKAMDRAARMCIGSQRGRYGMQSMALHAQQDRRLDAARCPQCGSSDYTQHEGASPLPPAADSIATAAPSTAASWHPDPAGRFEFRWWDGAHWTDQVSRAGVQSTDPI